MLVKIWLYLTKAVITGDVDEVRVQSEEPNLRSLLSSGLFALLLSHFSQIVFFGNPPHAFCTRLTPLAVTEEKPHNLLISIVYANKRG